MLLSLLLEMAFPNNTYSLSFHVHYTYDVSLHVQYTTTPQTVDRLLSIAIATIMTTTTMRISFDFLKTTHPTVPKRHNPNRFQVIEKEGRLGTFLRTRLHRWKTFERRHPRASYGHSTHRADSRALSTSKITKRGDTLTHTL